MSGRCACLPEPGCSRLPGEESPAVSKAHSENGSGAFQHVMCAEHLVATQSTCSRDVYFPQNPAISQLAPCSPVLEGLQLGSSQSELC